MKSLKKILKWFFICLIAILVVGFFYVYFILLAKPDSVAHMTEVNDHAWHTVNLGGRSLCSDGSDYFIFVRKGKSNNTIIHFSGGGACWDDATCSAPITITAALLHGDEKDLKVFYYPKVLNFFDRFLKGGILNKENENNPFKDWNIVFIPYCTGDFHVGNATNTYTVDGKSTEVHHNGRNNTLTALEWTFANFKSPEKILISGESAGGFASAYWAPYVAEHYTDDEKIYQLSDCSQLTSHRWPAIMDSLWKSDTEAFLNFKIDSDAYGDALLNRTNSTAKKIKHLNSNTLYDAVLPRFYAVLHHRHTSNNEYIFDWSKGMRESIKRLASGNIDYEYFLTDCRYDPEKVATPHTLLGSDSSIYACKANMLTYIEWLRLNVIDDESVSVGSELLETP
ncbi:hypothetical protein J2X69_000660 [Algoriphagus sp. 4150]|uniref:pectin acetylesterase-family hydrolase n=1 Tax=Algoriphagus sp. 4150 TaxID=2817756 RepID=UPI002859C176|nr:pectin acetylesterase-family hydrolase [Algoriphagus sp. 4150]MDR7128332.1 hypothetical protein [Algoriphagus sp. 4150]